MAQVITFLTARARKKWMVDWRFPFAHRVWEITYTFEAD